MLFARQFTIRYCELFCFGFLSGIRSNILTTERSFGESNRNLRVPFRKHYKAVRIAYEKIFPGLFPTIYFIRINECSGAISSSVSESRQPFAYGDSAQAWDYSARSAADFTCRTSRDSATGRRCGNPT